jgi:hypothetical protein
MNRGSMAIMIVWLSILTVGMVGLLPISKVSANNEAEGEFYDSDGRGGIDMISRYRNWRKSWTEIIPGRFSAGANTGLCFYDRDKGQGEIYTCDDLGHIRRLRRYNNWRKTWHQIVPGNFDSNPSITDLLFYDRSAGVGEFFALDGSGGMTLLRRYENWRKTWDLIVPGNFSASPGEFGSGPYTDLLGDWYR